MNNKISKILVATLALPAGVSAQSDVSGDGATRTLEEVIITARKRAEALTDAPIAVTAITDADIEAANFQNIRDLAKVTPGFVFEGFDTFPGRFDSVPFIRGVTFDFPSPIRQFVSVFVDGVYVAGGTEGLGVEDVARVEVIKGPQSAQFGRATFAGAINYVTKDPSDEFRANVSLTAAEYADYNLRGTIEGPLFPGVSARLSGRFASRDGHYKNNLDPSQRLGDQETQSLGLTVLFEPNDRFRARVRGFASEVDDGPAASSLFDASFSTLFPGGVRPYFAGTLPSVPGSLVGQNSTRGDFASWIADARSVGTTFIGGEPDGFGLERESSRFSLDGSYDFGPVVLSGVFGVNSEEGLTLFDFDQTPRNTFTNMFGRAFEDSSLELRLSGSALDDRLDWSIGVSRLEIEFDTNGAFGFQAIGQAISFAARANGAAITRTDVTTDAVFGDVSYQITDKWTASLELRDQEDEIVLREQGNPNVTEQAGTFDSLLPRFTLSYEPVEDLMLYASYSEGNLPGGFNANFINLTPSQQQEVRQTLPNASDTFDEETLENIEIGWKHVLLGGRATYSVALYQMDRTDQVTTATAPYSNPDFGQPNQPETIVTTLSVNSAATEITGLEFEGRFVANDNWEFSGMFAYTEAEVTAFPASGDAGDYQLAFGTSEGFIGTTAPRYPEWQASLSATYSAPANLFGSDSWYVRGDVFWQDEFFLSTANVGLAPSWLEANLRAGLRSGHWSAELFVRNLTDEDAVTAANNTATSVPGAFVPFTESVAVGLRDKRQVGLRLDYRFF